jgi:hypothetical protein
MRVCCNQQDCTFETPFSSSSHIFPTSHHQDTPTHLAVAWGIQGLGFEALETVFTLVGGVPLLSKSKFAWLMCEWVCDAVNLVLIKFLIDQCILKSLDHSCTDGPG